MKQFSCVMAVCLLAPALVWGESNESPTSQMEVQSVSAAQRELDELAELSALIKEDLGEMAQKAEDVIQTTSAIITLSKKMKEAEAKEKIKPVSDNNFAVDPRSGDFGKIQDKLESLKEEHWSRFVIPNHEFRFFKRERDLITVQNPDSLKKIVEGIAKARDQFLPAGCFDLEKKTYSEATICQKRLSICGESGFESQEGRLVAMKINEQLKMESVDLVLPEDAESALGDRYDVSSDRAALFSDETFYFCKLAARLGAKFKAAPQVYPTGDVASNKAP